MNKKTDGANKEEAQRESQVKPKWAGPKKGGVTLPYDQTLSRMGDKQESKTDSHFALQ